MSAISMFPVGRILIDFYRSFCLVNCLAYRDVFVRLHGEKFEWNEILLLRVDMEKRMGVFKGLKYRVNLSDGKFQKLVSSPDR